MSAMTEIKLKEILRDFHTIKIHIKILENCLDIHSSKNILTQYNKELLQMKVLMDSMALLSEDENFVINTHLICHSTWIETTKLYSKKYGNSNGKSERTLKRIQRKALKSMLKFINSLPLENYFDEM